MSINITARDQPVGLINPTLTYCFANASLQMLFSILELRRILLARDTSADDDTMRSLQQLIVDMEQKKPYTSAEALLNNLGMGKKQEDSQEFLYRIFGLLRENLPEQCKMEFFISQSPRMFIDDENVLVTRVDLNNSLADVLNECSDEVTFRKNLIIYVHRTGPNGTTKLRDPFNFPLQISIYQRKYKLTSVIAHAGNALFGHYISYVLSNNDWFMCNDRKVTTVSSENVLSTSGADGHVGFLCSHLLYRQEE